MTPSWHLAFLQDKGTNFYRSQSFSLLLLDLASRSRGCLWIFYISTIDVLVSSLESAWNIWCATTIHYVVCKVQTFVHLLRHFPPSWLRPGGGRLHSESNAAIFVDEWFVSCLNSFEINTETDEQSRCPGSRQKFLNFPIKSRICKLRKIFFMSLMDWH